MPALIHCSSSRGKIVFDEIVVCFSKVVRDQSRSSDLREVDNEQAPDICVHPLPVCIVFKYTVDDNIQRASLFRAIFFTATPPLRSIHQSCNDYNLVSSLSFSVLECSKRALLLAHCERWKDGLSAPCWTR